VTYAHWTVLPLLLHLLLTTVVGLTSLSRRFAAARSGKTKLADIALNNAAWPDDARRFGNNFDNQFQAPMLAYVGVAMLLATGLADGVSTALMWVFIGLRLLHSYEHTTRNFVPTRMKYFLASYFTILLLWLWFALRFFVTG
jgi:hypothetical protein